MSNPLYISQLAFTTGEVSPDVSSRFDLEQYKSALLEAENVVIRPYGAVAKRQGSQYMGQVKYSDKPTRLFEFTTNTNNSFMLEFGDKYIRVWNYGVYTGVEFATPFDSDILFDLNCIQSGDVMFICSGKYPIQTLSRYSDTDWRMSAYKLTEQPYDEINTDNGHTLTVNGDTITSTKDLFTQDMVGSVAQIAYYIEAVHTTQSGGAVEKKYGVGRFSKRENAVYNNIDYNVERFSTDVELSWKFTTHGTWEGTVKIQISNNDGQTWKDYRTYTSNKDYNVTDSGKIEAGARLKYISDIKSGSVNCDLSILPFMQYGVVEIVSVENSKTAKVNILNGIKEGEPSHKWKLGSWNRGNGYPKLCTFYQDRFVVAATNKKPNYIWMSRTGDYPNFGVEKVEGTITDDSAITLPVINRKMCEIRHLVPANDLIILTSGNEWIVSGDKTITPTNCNLKTQTQRGALSCEPQFIGNRCVFVQERGGTVRDMGYSYESDNYTGQDLTLFVKTRVRGYLTITSAYAQDPDSIIYYIRNDGEINCLTYIPEQKVYGWSHFVTNGKYLYCESVSEGEQDSIYILVERTLQGKKVKCIERMVPLYSDDVNVFLDCYVEFKSSNAIDSINIPHLSGQTVQVVIDDNQQPDVVVPHDGLLQLNVSGSNIKIGLPFTSKIRVPSVEMQMQDGTLQGRVATVSRVVLRVHKSFGGKIGRTFDRMDDITLPPDKLFTGDKPVILPKMGVNYSTDTSICIKHNDPFPFNLLSITRIVEIGGGLRDVPGL
nr:MAG TPA: stabilization protein [Caudoviricetes sp.]